MLNAFKNPPPAQNVLYVHRAALLSRKNAKQFLRDAKVLLEADSCGHAYGLLVLAEEEAGKALILHSYADGILRNPEWLAAATAKHEAKHAAMVTSVALRLLWFCLFALRPTANPSSHRRNWANRSDVDKRPSIRERVRLAIDDLAGTVQTLADFFDELKDLGDLQNRRERGFFVDFGRDGKPESPFDVTRTDCLRYYRLAKVRVAAIEEFLGNPKTSLKARQFCNSLPDDMRKQIARMERFLFSEKGLRKCLAWLSGDEPESAAKALRLFAANQPSITHLQNSLSKAYQSRFSERTADATRAGTT